MRGKGIILPITRQGGDRHVDDLPRAAGSTGVQQLVRENKPRGPAAGASVIAGFPPMTPTLPLLEAQTFTGQSESA